MMFKARKGMIIAAGMVTMILIMAISPSLAADVPLMTKETLKDHLEKGGVVIVDVRQGRDWDASEFKIQGAERVESKDIATWAQKQDKSKTTVLYCA